MSAWEFLTRQRDAMTAWLAVVALLVFFAVRLAPAKWRQVLLVLFALIIICIGYLATGGWLYWL